MGAFRSSIAWTKSLRGSYRSSNMAYLTFFKRLPVVIALIGALTGCGSDGDASESSDDAGRDGSPAAGDASSVPGTDASGGTDAAPDAVAPGDGGLPPGATAFVLGQPDATA